MSKAFEEFAKIARINRACVITEKIDGTNASIYIPEPGMEVESGFDPVTGAAMPFLVGSRTRWITPLTDNYGFARWAYEHATELLALGPGHHFGEWWGAGIQRKYGIGEKRFSLFNVARWMDTTGTDDPRPDELLGDKQQWAPACCRVVPILYRGPFRTDVIEQAMADLRVKGSAAAPGFMRPEGVVIWHEAARVLFKATLEKDNEPKGQVGDR